MKGRHRPGQRSPHACSCPGKVLKSGRSVGREMGAILGCPQRARAGGRSPEPWRAKASRLRPTPTPHSGCSFSGLCPLGLLHQCHGAGFPPAQAQLLLIFSSISFLPGQSKQPLARFPSYQFLRDNVPSWLSGVSPLNRDDSCPGSRPARPTGQHPRLFATSPASDPRDPAPRGQLRLPWPE